jgi:hypothetical protein
MINALLSQLAGHYREWSSYVSGVFQSEWVTQQEALEALGISRATLHRLRAAGIIRDGVHSLRVGLSSRSPLRFNLPACALALQVHTLAMHAAPAQN